MEDLLLGLGVRTRIEIIPNGVDLQRFHLVTSKDESRTLRAALGIGENDEMITTVGALSPGKGSDVLVKGWSKLAASFPEAHLVIVGPLFDESHPKRGAFRRKIEDLIATCLCFRP
jgi:glycosyltransferase involved in cell wall biosynthesis